MQKEDTHLVFKGIQNTGVLDYVACWYYKSAQYIKGKKISVGFVSTNSIVQGIQIPSLWKLLIVKEKVKIHFAHQTFKWSNEAKGVAAVYCVIIGFANFDTRKKRLFEYEMVAGEALQRIVSQINPFLLEANDIFIEPQTYPIFETPKMMKGNAAIDDGNFLFFTEEEKNLFIQKYPSEAHLVRKFIGSDELINSYHRYCLWLKDATPKETKENPEIKRRIENVRKFRADSKKEATKKWAELPTLFMEDRQPDTDYLMIPVVSSEFRKYIPIGFFTKEVIASYSAFILPNAGLYEFGIISSLMHNIWIKNICGRLEGRIRYSNTLGYNNFPWPVEKQIKTVEDASIEVLNVREEFPNSTLAELYDPNSMPPKLIKAHQNLDKVVDRCYRLQPFPSESKRMEFLLELYEMHTRPLAGSKKKKSDRKMK